MGAGIIGGLAYAGWKAWRTRVPARPQGPEWSAAPFPFPPVPRPASTPRSWVDPDADGSCPVTHPVKAKLSSGIYHLPGGASYERTKPDRCYVDAAAAEADGLRQSKV
jgi:hypothetical protein